MRRGEPGWIMECTQEGYSLGWHYILGEFDHWVKQGFIPRARVDVKVEIHPMFTGVIVNDN